MKYPGLSTAKIDRVVIVTQAFENNLPALAQELYKNNNAWDLLFFANDLVDPLVVPLGTSLRVPNYRQALEKPTLGIMS